jgi:protein KRI1
MEPPSKKMRKLLDDDSDSDSGDDAGGVLLGKQSSDTGFKVNEDYARRFEHNKKREEVARRRCIHSTFFRFGCMLTLA